MAPLLSLRQLFPTRTWAHAASWILKIAPWDSRTMSILKAFPIPPLWVGKGGHFVITGCLNPRVNGTQNEIQACSDSSMPSSLFLPWVQGACSTYIHYIVLITLCPNASFYLLIEHVFTVCLPCARIKTITTTNPDSQRASNLTRRKKQQKR